MIKKGLRQLLSEARAVVPDIDAAEAIGLVGDEGSLFVDVRDPQETAKGHIPGAILAPRGFLELIADPDAPPHNPALVSGKRLILYCASGIRSSLAAKTLSDMGLDNLVNLAGGMQAWVRAGGPVEH